MNPQLIPLAQSVTTAVIEIILLLIGAALIGFLTAWFYQKSYYVPIVKKLEAEKEELNRKIDSLNNEISGLKARVSDLEKVIGEKNNIISQKDKEITELKARIKPQ
jgi:peptidoglycan hydrolase CwlO-like protein